MSALPKNPESTALALRIIRADSGRGTRQQTARRILRNIRAELPHEPPDQIAAILRHLGAAEMADQEAEAALFVRMVKPRFEEPIVQGWKIHTIRPPAKRDWIIGARLSLRVWTGLPYRSPQREILMTTLKQVEPIMIDQAGIRLRGKFHYESNRSERPFLESLANRDGFSDWKEMKQWFLDNHRSFAKGEPFKGELIHWEPPARSDV